VDPKQKRVLFEQCLETMRRAWRGDPVTVGAGEHAETVVLDPLPVQQPHPPLWVAAFGPKALAQAGRLGLPYLASPVETMTALSENYLRHGEAAAAAGLGAVATVPVMRTVFVTDDARIGRQIRDRLTADALRTRLGAAVVRPETAALDDWCIVGEAAFVRERIAEYRERLRVTHLIVTRLRISGIQPDLVRRSVEQVPDLIDTTRGGEP
jgi:alkanesulfonate monooxygenase SsuD/methylene tetrahydromethanopterin reductase-like flavin-dependent oxidoreductase (luciferase family)